MDEETDCVALAATMTFEEVMKPFQKLTNRNRKIPRPLIETLMAKETIAAKILLEVEELLKRQENATLSGRLSKLEKIVEPKHPTKTHVEQPAKRTGKLVSKNKKDLVELIRTRDDCPIRKSLIIKPPEGT